MHKNATVLSRSRPNVASQTWNIFLRFSAVTCRTFISTLFPFLSRITRRDGAELCALFITFDEVEAILPENVQVQLLSHPYLYATRMRNLICKVIGEIFSCCLLMGFLPNYTA